LATVVVVYGVFISGILVAGKNSITACLGWPIYSTQLFQVDSLGMGNILRLTFSVLGIWLIVATLVQVWRSRQERPAIFGIARWVLAAFLLEALLQVLLLIFGFKIPLLVPYTVTAALRWGGFLDTIVEGVTGRYFDEPTPGLIAAALTASSNS